MIKACIFDLDGTLADTLESMAIAANEALEQFGLRPLPVDNYKYYAGDGAKTLVERAMKDGGDPQLVHFDQVYRSYSQKFEKDCTYKVKVYDGILKMLDDLRTRGIKTAVLSNKPHARVLDVIGKLFGTGVFDHVQGQQDDIPKKPDPAGALMTARLLGVKPKECMYFGDTNVDMKTGNAAGMYTVGVLWGFRTRRELEENQAHHILSSPDQIVALVDMKNHGMPADPKVRLVVSDVDGTLVKTGQTCLEDGFIDVVDALMDRGITFAVASGRQRISIQSLFKDSKRPLYMISENGGNLYYDGKDLDFHPFSKEEYREIVEGVKAYSSDVFFAMAAPDVYYTESGNPEFSQTLSRQYFFKMKEVEDIVHLDHPVCKIAVYTLHGDVQEFARHFQNMWGDRMNIAVSGDHWVDFNPKEIGKGTGVKFLQEQLKITPEETMVFGDNENDVSMLQCARYSCAVSDAFPAAKRAAAYETDSVLEELKKLLKAVDAAVENQA
ncbi:MAG TPA: Cof-type HAD-IIB family hydrolase [Candidatus Scybalocola faecavium]|nr:Cof-type HAD-IIB family hydrolase [Candidatus Scybalocola faecavium]